MGTAPLAVPILRALAARPAVDIAAVVTQPDRPKGRSLQPQLSAVKRFALERRWTVLQPEKARDPSFVETIRTLAPELIVVVAYGQILPPTLLQIPKFGCLNVHTSILPRHRGAAPIQWALLNGDSETGVTLMRMDAGLDTGDIVAIERTAIQPEDDAMTLHDRLAALGADLLVKTLPGYVAGRILPTPQPSTGASYARKISKEDGRIDWKLAAETLHNRVRALTPWPGAYTLWPSSPSPKLLKIWKSEVVRQEPGLPGTVRVLNHSELIVACGTDGLRLLEVQIEGGRRMASRSFLAGHPCVDPFRFE